jgi:benzoate-CoA ligase
MAQFSSADHRASPPSIDIPHDYNAAYDLIERNLCAGRGTKIAFHDTSGAHTYDELAERVNRFADAITVLGVEMEQLVLLCLHDTIDFPTAFLGAIKAGVVPVAVSALLTQGEYEHLLVDSRARVLFVSESLIPTFAPLLGKSPFLRHVIVSGTNAHGQLLFTEFVAAGATRFDPGPYVCRADCMSRPWRWKPRSSRIPRCSKLQWSVRRTRRT